MMDTNILLGMVIVAAAIAIIAYLVRHGKITTAAVHAAAADVQSHVSGVVAGAQSDIQKLVATTAIAAARKPASATLSAPGAAVPTATTATTAIPPPSPAAADGAGSLLTPGATLETAPQPAPIDAGSTQAAPAVPEHQLATAAAPAAAHGDGMNNQLTNPASMYFGMHRLDRATEVAFLIALACGDWQTQQDLVGPTMWSRYVGAYTAGSGPFYAPKQGTLERVFTPETKVVGVRGVTPEEFAAITPEQKAKIEAFAGVPVA